MIDEKVLIERLEEQKSDWNYDYNVPINDAIKIVNQLAEEHNNGWIPCSEMLFPRYGQKVFATVRTDIATHDVIITKYERQEYWHNGIVIAWMPLPAPYKGEQK